MKAITRSGTVYDVKFRNTNDLFMLYLCERDGTALSWRDFDGLINISGEWYHCLMEAGISNNEVIPAVRLCKDAIDALGLNTEKSVCIRLDSTPKEEFDAFYGEMLKSIKEKAKELSFTYIEFTDDFICGSDCAEKCDYLYFNEKALNILNAFKAIDKLEDRLKFTSCFEGKDTTYRVDSTNMDKLFALATPKLKEIEERKKLEEIEERKEIEEFRRVKEAIENGAIFFNCESAPHDEDLSEAILTRPCPNSGSFILTHRIPAEVFSKIKKFGVYYDYDFLEECDMFWSAPGWRFGKEAIETLLRDNFKVFVDYEEVSLTEDSETKKPRPKPEGIRIENGGDNDPLKGVDFK